MIVKILDYDKISIDGSEYSLNDISVDVDRSALSEALKEYLFDLTNLANKEIANSLIMAKPSSVADSVRVDALTAEINQLKTQLSPAICEIIPQLLESGLLRWGQDAVSAVDAVNGELIMGLILDLKAVAMESPSWNQCDRIKELFGTIAAMSNVYPSSEQALAMQAILDKGCPSTGPVKAERLSFIPWI